MLISNYVILFYYKCNWRQNKFDAEQQKIFANRAFYTTS